MSLDDFYFAINDVRPSLIRTEADEVTYNLHILIRFELEQALINDDLRVADLPAAWHAKYREYLGIQSPTDADGVLQDVHWSSGAFGYFPTYSLGNLYAAQFFEKAEQDLGDLHAMFGRGEFLPLREWLRDEHPFARPALPGRRAGPPRHRRAAIARRADAAPPRQILAAVRSGPMTLPILPVVAGSEELRQILTPCSVLRAPCSLPHRLFSPPNNGRLVQLAICNDGFRSATNRFASDPQWRLSPWPRWQAAHGAATNYSFRTAPTPTRGPSVPRAMRSSR